MASTPQVQLAPANPILTGFGVAYLQQQNKFIAPQIFPWRRMRTMTGRYPVYTLDDTLRDEVDELVGAAESPEVGFSRKHETVTTRRFGGRMAENDEQVAEWAEGGGLSVSQAITRHVVGKMLIKMEREWHGKFFRSGVWGIDYAGADEDNTTTGRWDRDGVDFIKNIQLACDLVESNTGRRPNHMVIGATVKTRMENTEFFRKLRAENVIWSPDPSAPMRRPTKLETATGLDRIHVSRAVRTKSKVGVRKANIDVDFIAGRSALLIYVEPELEPIGPLTPTGGCTFTTRNNMGRALSGNRMGIAVYRYADQPKRALWTDVVGNWEHKVVAPDVAVFFEDIVSDS